MPHRRDLPTGHRVFEIPKEALSIWRQSEVTQALRAKYSRLMWSAIWGLVSQSQTSTDSKIAQIGERINVYRGLYELLGGKVDDFRRD